MPTHYKRASVPVALCSAPFGSAFNSPYWWLARAGEPITCLKCLKIIVSYHPDKMIITEPGNIPRMVSRNPVGEKRK